MRAPGFWQHDGVLARLLSPLSLVWEMAAASRIAQGGWRAPVPVICCGNVGVGGAGKTTLALDLGARLLQRGARPAFLSRGYGGSGPGTLRVLPDDGADSVGDEPKLLSEIAACWVGADRAATARAAINEGATVLVMDDGLQNPGLLKDLSLLVVDGAAGFGNGRMLPAGPLREPVAAGASRCTAAVMIGSDATGAAAMLPPDLPILRAELAATGPALAGRRVFAFAGIGRPAKFFASLRAAGAELAGSAAFPDHHRFTPGQVARLHRRAAALGAELATTPKDAVRLPPASRATVLVVGVSLRWYDPAQIEALLGTVA